VKSRKLLRAHTSGNDGAADQNKMAGEFPFARIPDFAAGCRGRQRAEPVGSLTTKNAVILGASKNLSSTTRAKKERFFDALRMTAQYVRIMRLKGNAMRTNPGASSREEFPHPHACVKLFPMRIRKNSYGIFVFIVALFLLLQLIHSLSVSPTPAKPSGFAESGEARLGPPDIYPDPTRTPGAADPDITQENIHQTICNPRWSTKSIRPPESYTHELKVEQIREYGYADHQLKDYEEDHLIPLEVGGNPTDPKNLWPEPYETSIAEGGAHFKDQVENYLHDQVCSGAMRLDEAQREIADDWYRVYKTSVAH
jgi:hypothetical protein